MKHLLFIALLLASDIAFSQSRIPLPEVSPEANMVEKIGYTTFTIHHGKPFARGRKIFGEVVPYNQLWRTGAGKTTTIAFDTPVMIANQTVPAGTYALLTIPGEKEWKVMLNTNTSRLYGDPSEYDPKTETLSFNVSPAKATRYHEALTFSLDVVNFDAVFYLAWENTQISFPIKTLTLDKARAEIEKNVNAHPKDREALEQAASFYSFNNLDLPQALAWLERAEAISGKDDRWLLWLRIEILVRMKKYNEAIKTAEHAIAVLKATKPEAWEENVKDYQDKIQRWSKAK